MNNFFSGSYPTLNIIFDSRCFLREEILFESEKQSYTNDYFRVSLLKKKFKEKDKSKFGNIVKVKILSKRKDRLFAELV